MNQPSAAAMLEAALTELRAAFDLFDLDGDGLLDLVELTTALRALGLKVSARDVEQLAASVGGRGLIDFDGFVRLVEPVPAGLDHEADLHEAFRVIDTNGDGTISRSELRAAFKAQAQPDATREVDRIFELVDGEMDFEAFRKIVGE